MESFSLLVHRCVTGVHWQNQAVESWKWRRCYLAGDGWCMHCLQILQSSNMVAVYSLCRKMKGSLPSEPAGQALESIAASAALLQISAGIVKILIMAILHCQLFLLLFPVRHSPDHARSTLRANLIDLCTVRYAIFQAGLVQLSILQSCAPW